MTVPDDGSYEPKHGRVYVCTLKCCVLLHTSSGFQPLCLFVTSRKMNERDAYRHWFGGLYSSNVYKTHVLPRLYAGADSAKVVALFNTNASACHLTLISSFNSRT